MPTDRRYEAVRVSVGVDEAGEMTGVLSVYFTLETPTRIDPSAETIGQLTVQDQAGRDLMAVDVPRPEPVSIVGPDGGGEVALPDSTSVVLPWPEEAREVGHGGQAYAPAPPPALSPGAEDAPPPTGPAAADVTSLPTVEAVHETGPAEERFDFVVVGDGYGAEHHATFIADVQRFSSALLSTEPYATFAERINVWAVPTKMGAGGSALACHHGCHGISRLICCDEGATLALAHAAVASAESVLVLTNSDAYGGSGGRVAISYRGAQMATVMLHELGHTLDLQDEYTYETVASGVYAPTSAGPNCSLSEPPQWDHWLDQPEVGAFPGCRFATAFRPTDQGCMMHRVGVPGYCPVCREHVALRIYAALGGLITAVTPEAVDDSPILIGDAPERFEIETQAVGEPTYAWNLDSSPAGDDSPALEVSACSVPGPTLLRATVTDRTELVRRDPDGVTSDSVLWRLGADPEAATDGCLPMCIGDACEIGTACCHPGVLCYPTSADGGASSCCAIFDFRCGADADCCGEMACVGGRCACQEAGSPCVSHRECCGAAICEEGTCRL